VDAKPIHQDQAIAPTAMGAGTAAPARANTAAIANRPGAGTDFSRQLAEVTVRKGDTLTSVVRSQWMAQGGAREALSASQAHRWALQVARENGLANPDLIVAGQSLVVGVPPKVKDMNAPRTEMASAAAAAAASRVTAWAAASAPISTTSAAQARSIVRIDAPLDPREAANPLLRQTLDRAIGLGYIPQRDRESVAERIAVLANKHGFMPDDFAKTVLMESDGLNPRATNGNCHGIIQFCSGPDRGAASAGYGQRPREILNLSVLQQLDLVDRYFDDTRLKDFRGRDGRVRLDDLYLTVLTPAARQERQPNAPLPIAGPQALDLHVRRERESPITRSSILAGLNVNAKSRLGQFMVADLMAR
jgi:hypothetical protein